MRAASREEIFLSWGDVKRLFLCHRRRIQSAALITGLGVFLVLLLSPLKYKIEATYKQSSKQKELSLNMKEMFQQFIEMPGESATAAMMQSNAVFKKGVEDLGLQVGCAPKWIGFTLLKRIADRIRILCGGDLEDPDSFAFQNVSYAGEKPLTLDSKSWGRGWLSAV